MLGRPFYQLSNADKVALSGHSLVSLHFANASSVSFELKLEQVWGNDNLHLV